MRQMYLGSVCFLVLVGCGAEDRVAYRCPVELGPGFVGADSALPCAQVERNAVLARRIMSEVAADFGDRLVTSITVREVESWNVEGARAWGTTTFYGRDAEMKLGHSMWSLVHELGHVYLLYSTGDSDHAHLRWNVSGQARRDAEYQRAYEPLPTPASPKPGEQDPSPDQPPDDQPMVGD